MKSRFFVGLIAGVALTVLLIVLGAYIYFAQGFAPVATSSRPMPFEKTLARLGLHAALHKQELKTPPIAGAMVYQDNCDVCHGGARKREDRDRAANPESRV